MASDRSSTTTSNSQRSLDVFEVFRTKSVDLAQLRAAPLAETRKQYTIICPIASVDQLTPGVALACPPQLGKRNGIIFIQRHRSPGS